MKVVCICDAGVPEMLMQYMKKLPGCDVTLYTSALGAYLSGWTLEAREREDCPG